MKRYLTDKGGFLTERAGWRHVLVIPGPEDRTRRLGETTVYEVRSPRLPGSASYRLLWRRRRIREILTQEAPDLVEVADPYLGAWAALAAARRHGFPVVGYYHSDFPRSLVRTAERLLGRWAARGLALPVERYLAGVYRRMTATLAPSPYIAEVLGAYGVERVRAAPPGVDTEAFRPDPEAAARLRRELDLAADEALLLYVGRLAREKNVLSLLAMMERLRDRGPAGVPRCRLLLVGDGEQRRQVEAAARRRREILWRPYTDSLDELRACYSASDLMIHAGVHETFGLVSVEAQACGAPVVAVRGEGLESTVMPVDPGEEPAVLADSPRPGDLARAVERVLTAPGRFAGPAGVERVQAERRRARVVRRFRTDVAFEALVDVYREVIRTAHAGAQANHGWELSDPPLSTR